MTRLCLGGLVVGLVLAGSVRAQSIPDVLYLQFEEGAGQTTADVAIPGTGTVGALTPACVLTSGNAVIGVGALQTGPSANDGCILTNPVVPATTSFTIEFWIELVTVSGTVFPFGQTCNNSPGYLACGLTYNSPGNYSMQVWSNGTSVTFPAPLVGAIGNWCHLAIVSDSVLGTLDVYSNGQPFYSTTVTTFFTLQSYMTPGFNVGGALTSNCFTGAVTPVTQIDEFRIWGTARTATEIAANWNVDLFTGGPFLGTATPAPIAFNQASGAFLSTIPVNAFGSLVSPATPSTATLPAGTTMTINGSYTGTDLAGLSDISYAPLLVRVTAVPNADELLIQGIQTAVGGPPGYASFVGSSGAVVTRRVTFPIGSPIVTRIGQGSTALDAYANRLGTAPSWSLVFDIGPFGPRFVGLVTDYTTPVIAKESRLTTDGLGSVLLGDVGMAPGARLFHLFATQPAIPVGTGPLLGLELTPTVWTELQLPFPVTPFKVQADGAGAYAFLVGPGSIPSGFVVDTVTVEFVPPNFSIGYMSPVRRVTF